MSSQLVQTPNHTVFFLLLIEHEVDLVSNDPTNDPTARFDEKAFIEPLLRKIVSLKMLSASTPIDAETLDKVKRLVIIVALFKLFIRLL